MSQASSCTYLSPTPTTMLLSRHEDVFTGKGNEAPDGGMESWCLMGTGGKDEKVLEEDGGDGYTSVNGLMPLNCTFKSG